MAFPRENVDYVAPSVMHSGEIIRTGKSSPGKITGNESLVTSEQGCEFTLAQT
jgi:hypothetical protein